LSYRKLERQKETAVSMLTVLPSLNSGCQKGKGSRQQPFDLLHGLLVPITNHGRRKAVAGENMSDLEKRFERAQEEVTHLPERPDNNTLLELYALYKQATDGDIAGDRPSGFDLVGAAKYDARAELKGMEPDAAMAAYIALVEKLKAF